MIQNVNATQSRQNFGMSLKAGENFPAQFEKVYSRKGKKATETMLDTIAKVKRKQAGNDIFDLHLTGVGLFGGIKTKVTSEKDPTQARVITTVHKVANILLGFVPKAPLLEAKSEGLLNQSKLIKNRPRPLAQRVKDIVD